MKKTIKQWLEELPEPYRTQAIKYATKHWMKDGGIDGNHCTSLDQSLLSGFLFSKTIEGSDYWWRVYEKASAQE